MSLPNVPQVNGNRYSFASIDFQLLGKRYFGVKSINYSDGLDPGEVRGTAPQLLGRTKGKYSAEGSMELYEAEFSDFVAALLSAGPSLGFIDSVGFMEIPFEVSVSYAEENSPTITDTLVACRIKKVDKSRAEGTDPLTVKLDLHIMSIDYGVPNSSEIFNSVTPIDTVNT